MPIFSGGHAGKAYNLTGPEALSYGEVVEQMNEANGTSLAYHAISEEDMLQGARNNGMPEAAVQYMAVLYQVVRAGYAAAVTSDVQLVTGQPARDFAAFVDKRMCRG